jgi:hypothetical protein
MGFKYKIPLPSTTLSTTNSSLTVIPAAARALKITEIYLAGTGTASASNDIGLYRVGTAGVTGAGAVTPAPDNPAAPAVGFTNFTSYTTQPVVGTKVLDMPVNSNGGVFYWRPMKGDEIEIPAASLGVTLRSVSGTGTVAGWMTVEEI